MFLPPGLSAWLMIREFYLLPPQSQLFNLGRRPTSWWYHLHTPRLRCLHGHPETAVPDPYPTPPLWWASLSLDLGHWQHKNSAQVPVGPSHQLRLTFLFCWIEVSMRQPGLHDSLRITSQRKWLEIDLEIYTSIRWWPRCLTPVQDKCGRSIALEAFGLAKTMTSRQQKRKETWTSLHRRGHRKCDNVTFLWRTSLAGYLWFWR